MPKTPDEIKKAMLHCSPVSCRSDGCPYRDDTPKYEGDMPVCRMKLWHDMVCLIQQLEAERDALKDEVAGECETCKHNDACQEDGYCMWCDNKESDKTPCCNCIYGCNWEWRGVQKEG